MPSYDIPLFRQEKALPSPPRAASGPIAGPLGVIYRPDRQIHIRTEEYRPPSREAAALYRRVLQWARRFSYHGTTNGKMVFRCSFYDEQTYFVLSLATRHAGLPVTATLALTALPGAFDPIDPPPEAAPFVWNPHGNWGPMELTADLLHEAAFWGSSRAHLIAAAIPDQQIQAARMDTTCAEMSGLDALILHPSVPGREKATICFEFAEHPDLVLVAEIYHDIEVPYPPYGVPLEPQPLPKAPAPIRPKTRLKDASVPALRLFEPEPLTAPQPSIRPMQDLIETAVARLVEAYLTHDLLTVAYSGGKDSHAVLQVLAMALERIPSAERTTPVYLVSQDTGVENPRLIEHIRRVHRAVAEEATERGWPVVTRILTPRVEDGFWVAVLGKGYMAPNRSFKWCVDRLKLRPSNAFLGGLQGLHGYGDGLVLLGVRDSESAARAASIERHAMDDFHADHPLEGMRCGMPIRDWTTDEVFEFLAMVPPVWETRYDNMDLIRLYADANGECPLAVAHAGDRQGEEQMAAGCGKSRTGCWICTLVRDDTSLRRMNEKACGRYTGYLAVRDLLVYVSDPVSGFRMGYQRTRIAGTLMQGYGELTMDAVLVLLQGLLKANLPLSTQECLAIAREWQRREGRGEIRVPSSAWKSLEAHAALGVSQAESSP